MLQSSFSPALAQQVSPPDSQGLGIQQTITERMADQMMADDVEEGGEQGQMVLEGEQEREKGPGWGWQNKGALEEYRRAMEFVVDKGFSLKEFGDPFAEPAKNGTN